MVSFKEEQFIIEIQNTRETDYLERILFGASKVIVDTAKKDGYIEGLKEAEKEIERVQKEKEKARKRN